MFQSAPSGRASHRGCASGFYDVPPFRPRSFPPPVLSEATIGGWVTGPPEAVSVLPVFQGALNRSRLVGSLRLPLLGHLLLLEFQEALVILGLLLDARLFHLALFLLVKEIAFKP